MIESELESSGPLFVFPEFNSHDIGEIERIQQHFKIKSQNFTQLFLERARAGKIDKLSDEDWDRMENTDSHSDNILRGDWGGVAHCAESYNPPRDWRTLKARMESGEPLHAPIIAKRGDILHKVSGNTRLMVARAMGVKPGVLVVDISDIQ